MKCQDCREFIGDICMKAQDGKISEMEDQVCLLKMQISLLRAIWESLQDEEDYV
jgi:hypothetical protein